MCCILLDSYRQSCWGHMGGIPNWFCDLYVSLTFTALIMSCHSGIILAFLCWVPKFTTLPEIAPKCIIFVIFILLISVWNLGSVINFHIWGWICNFIDLCYYLVLLYTSPSYIFNFNRLWCANLNASTNVLMVFMPGTQLLMSLINECRLLILFDFQ